MTAASPVNVLHLVNTLEHGGVYRHVMNLADGLESEGIRCRLAAWVPQGNPLPSDPRFTSLPIYREDGRRRSPAGILRSVVALRRMLHEQRIDILHSHSRLAAMLSALAVAPRSRVRRLHTVHTNFTDLRWFPFYPSDLIAVSEGLAEAFRSQVHGIARARIHVIHNGVDIKEEVPSSHAASHGSRGRFLFVGRLVAQKGLPLLREALKRMPREEIPEVQVFGEGPLEEDLRCAAHDGLPLRLEGFHPDPFARADFVQALLFPSNQLEGFGYVVIEAFARGIPVIAADLPVLRGVVVHEQTGLLVPPGDIAAWTRVLRYAQTHPQEMQAMGERGRELVRQSFRRDVMIHKTAAVYRRLLSR